MHLLIWTSGLNLHFSIAKSKKWKKNCCSRSTRHHTHTTLHLAAVFLPISLHTFRKEAKKYSCLHQPQPLRATFALWQPHVLPPPFAPVHLSHNFYLPCNISSSNKRGRWMPSTLPLSLYSQSSIIIIIILSRRCHPLRSHERRHTHTHACTAQPGFWDLTPAVSKSCPAIGE